LALKSIESLTIFSHGDALNYHLVIPRLVIESGWSEVFKSFFAVFLSGYYELIFFIPNLIFGSTVYTQISSQLVQFLSSSGLSCFLFLKYIKNKKYAYLACITLLTLSKGGDFLLYAKNDAFLATLCLWLFLIIMTKKEENWSARTLGMFYGFIPAIKLSGLFFLFPLSFYILSKKYQKPKFILQFALIALLVYSPILLIKNYYLGGAIFFPALLSIFPGNLPQNTIDLFNNFTNAKMTFSSLKLNLGFFFISKALMIFFLPLIFKFHRDKKLLKMSAIIVINFALVLIMNGGIYSERFLFPMFFTMVATFFIALSNLELQNKFIYAIIIILLADSKIDKTIKRSWNVLQYPVSDIQAQRKKKIPLSTVWDYVKVESKNQYTYIFTDEFVQTFYSPKGARIDMYPSSPEAFAYKDCSDPNFLKKYKYFILTWKFNSPCNQIIKEQTKKIFNVGRYDLLEVK
jgi:hypothetical protein